MRETTQRATPEEKRAWLEVVEKRAAAVGFTSHGISGSTAAPSLSLSCDIRQRHYGYDLRVHFEGEAPKLHIDWSTDALAIIDETHLVEILGRLRERLALESARAAKRDKLRTLRVRAIEGRVSAIAAARNIEYAICPMHTKVQVALRLDDKRALVVCFSYKDAIEAVDRLGPTHDDLRRAMARQGSFEVHAATRWATWKKSSHSA